MSLANRTTYSPYGAWELKASYQKNLLMAIAVTVGIVVLSTTGLLIVDSGPVAETRLLPRDSVITIIDWPHVLPPTIIKELPSVADGNRAWEEFVKGIPKPVADDLIIDEVAVIASRDDLQTRGYDGTISEGNGGMLLGNGSLGGVGMIDTDPPPFVPLEKYPEMIHHENPEYPSLARKAGLEGTVWIKALVSKDGLVEKAVVMKTSEIASLDESALRAAYRNRFTPGIQNGQAVAVWVAYKVDFVLK
jgi:TonB family protein